MPSIRKEAELLERLWARVASLIPPTPANPKGGRPRHDDRECLWHDLPSEYPSRPTCWRRHADWAAFGIWTELWSAAFEELTAAGNLAMDELFSEAAFVPAQKGAFEVGKGCRIELVTDTNGIPIGFATLGDDIAESELIGPALQAILEVVELPCGGP